MRALVILAIVGLVGVALSGCLGARIDASNERTLHVQAGTPQNDLRFTPSTIRLVPGETVSIVVHNNGTQPHAFVNHDFHLHSGTLAPGQTATVPFTAPESGTFEITCDAPGHSEAGMKGTIEVAA